MQIEALYTYPIKSLRGCSVSTAELTSNGFPLDRRYMLLKDHGSIDAAPKGSTSRYQNMHVSGFPSMCLFTTALEGFNPSDPSSGNITVTYNHPQNGSTANLTVPTAPNTSELGEIDVVMHQSAVKALQMPDDCSAFFTEHFGFPVILAHLGAGYRTVLGNIHPDASARNPKMQSSNSSSSWLSSITSIASSVPSILSASSQPSPEHDPHRITFADCASYLLVSSTSLDEVTRRLPDNVSMDVTKFRPNIVVSGAKEPWEEDYWSEVVFKSNDDLDDEAATLALTANCLRCMSLNVDYDTGAFGNLGVLQKLQKDRRVDPGVPYSPCFGRYSFLVEKGNGESTRKMLRVGDRAQVTKRNEDRTTFKWPGLGATKKDNLYAL